MSLAHSARICAGMAILFVGCRTPANQASQVVALGPPASCRVVEAPAELRPPAVIPRSGVTPAACQEPDRAPLPPCDTDDPFAGQTELSSERLVAEVLARNPSLAAMVAAWQAAAQRYPQAVSLEDPMLMLAMGPGTFGDPNHDVAWMVEGSQKIPWSGKRELRGQQAEAEADSAHWDVDDAESRLVESTRLAYLDYFLVRRQRKINDENVSVLTELRGSALAEYRAALVTQQDVLQADVELAEMQRRQFELRRMDAVAVARINTLLHREPSQPLPAPPRELPTGSQTAPLATLQELAAERRPDLMGLGAQVRAAQAAVGIAESDYYPDVSVVGRYDGFWQHADRDLAPMVGVNLNVPLHNDRRQAAVCEARFRLSQRQAEFEARLDEIHGDVAAAYAQLAESGRVVELYRQTVLPVAGQNLDSARANYTANKLDFMRLIEADRQLLMLREKNEESIADYHRRLAELERAVGGPLPAPPSPELLPR